MPSSVLPPSEHALTGILMLNMGGPETLEDVEPFLHNLFADRDLMRLPVQPQLSRLIARLRAPNVRRIYEQIGGGSPLLSWTREQARGLTERLNAQRPDLAPFLAVPAFRYSAPSLAEALESLLEAGVEHVIAFSQYPQFSCSTAGSSFNELWELVERRALATQCRWSVIDRWFDQPGYIDAMAEQIEATFASLSPAQRDHSTLLFSAHALPLSVVARGDTYPLEVATSAHAVIQRLRSARPYVLAFQSAVGPIRWLEPSTEHVLKQLGAQGIKDVVVAPLGFTSDHVETLYELDQLYADVAHQAGITGYHRVQSLNAAPSFLDALTSIVLEHLDAPDVNTPQYTRRCPGCPGGCRREIPRSPRIT